MKNKKAFITLLMCAAEGYVFTLGIWNHPNYVPCFFSPHFSGK